MTFSRPESEKDTSELYPYENYKYAILKMLHNNLELVLRIILISYFDKFVPGKEEYDNTKDKNVLYTAHRRPIYFVQHCTLDVCLLKRQSEGTEIFTQLVLACSWQSSGKSIGPE